MTELLSLGRELGLPIKGLHAGHHYGWTTDQAKADTMRGAGARVEFCRAAGSDAESRRFDGYQISFPQGAEAESPRSGTAA